MGALHAGHLALVERARAENDVVVVSVFVNPSQFGSEEDLDRYPRDLPRDARVAEDSGRGRSLLPGRGWRSIRRVSRRGSTWRSFSQGMEGDCPTRALPRRGHGLPEAVRDRPPGSCATSARRTSSRPRSWSGSSRTWRSSSRSASSRPSATRTGSRSRPGMRTSRRDEREAAPSDPPRARVAAGSAHREGASPRCVARTMLAGERRLRPRLRRRSPGWTGGSFSRSPPALARPRLIDNAILEEEVKT